MTTGTESLVSVLEDARRRGFLGPGPVEPHIEHALAFAEAAAVEPQRCLDLGSGGGVPGLALAGHWPSSEWVLLDAALRRAEFLRSAVERLGLGERVTVVQMRAEDAGRDTRWRATLDLVVARSFAGPAVTAECAAPLLRVDGRLVVSEPPELDPERWPAAALAELRLRLAGTYAGPPRLQVLDQVDSCPDRFPRRSGIPAKRPLW